MRLLKRGPWPGASRKGVAAHILLCAAHVATVLTGLVFVVQPSRSIQSTVSPFWALLWSMIFVVFGTAALVARLRRNWRAEAISLATIGGGLAVWGVAAISSSISDGSYGALQSGFRFISGALLMFGFALLAMEWVQLRKEPSPELIEGMMKRVTTALEAEAKAREEQP